MNSMDLETTHQQLKQQPRRASETQAIRLLLLLRVHETIFQASQETQIKLKRETVKRQVLESKYSSVTCFYPNPTRLLSIAVTTHARTHARPPHFHRTRERARRRRPDRGRDARLRSRSSAAGSPFERTGYHTNSPSLARQRSTNLLYSTRGDLLATNLRTYFTFFYTSQFFFFWIHFKYFRGGGAPVLTIRMDRMCIL
jgi:hypothetical protein